MKCMVVSSDSKFSRAWKFTDDIHKYPLSIVVMLIALSPQSAMAFTANISGSPNPNTGDYTVSWSNPAHYTYALQEMVVGGGSWIQITSTTGTSYPFTGKAPNDYFYRLKWQKLVCTGYPEPECNLVTYYSETASVTVQAPPPPQPPPPPPPPLGGADPGPESAADSDRIGSTAGEFRVNEFGAATYNIRILTAAGTAGVVPEIALNYSSDAGNGIAGYGWSIGGLSSIARCRQTLTQDNNAKSLDWTAEDRFCLDGQRLILTSGTYGSPGSTYQTEVDSGAWISAVGGVAGMPNRFDVTRKDGSLSHYGVSPNHGSTEARYQPASGKTLTWKIRQFADSVGNSIWYDYENDVNGHRIKRIRFAYGTNNGPTGHGARLVFYYENRKDDITGFVGGFETRSGKRLTRIASFNGSDQIREYQLSYHPYPSLSQFPNAAQISRLASVRECSDGSATICMPATTFDWRVPDDLAPIGSGYSIDLSNGTNGLLSYRPGDINGDGIMDLAWLESSSAGGGTTDIYLRLNYALNSNGTLTRETFTSGTEVVFGPIPNSPLLIGLEIFDYNADGRADVAVYDSGWKVVLSTPQTDGTWKLSNVPIDTNANRINAQFVDIDSDGLTDVVYKESLFSALHWWRKLGPDPSQGVSSPRYYYFEPEIPLIGLPLFGQYSVSTPGGQPDFNGDGKVDFLVIGTDSPLPLQGNQIISAYSVGEDPSDTILLKSFIEDVATGIMPASVQVVDINNDGYSDVFYAVSVGSIYFSDIDEFHLRINDGSLNFSTGVVDEPSMGPGVSNPDGQYGQFVDWNLDGYPDLLWKDTAGLKVWARYWDPGTNDFRSKVQIGTESTIDATVQFIDMTGDGVPDLTRMDPDNSNGTLDVQARVATSGPGSTTEAYNKIETITDGLGAITAVEYAALSDTDHYERLTVDTTTTYSEFCFNGECEMYPYTAVDLFSFYSTLNGDWTLPAGTHTLGKYKPVLELIGPTYVVSRVEESAPSTSNSLPGYVDASALRARSFYYGEAKLQASGRGYLGFERQKVVDETTGLQFVTNFRQDWPFIAYPLSNEVRTAGDHLLSRTENIWDFIEWTASSATTAQGSGTAPLGPLHAVLVSTESSSYSLESNGAVPGNLLSTVSRAIGHDQDTNVLTVTDELRDASSVLIKSIATVNEFGTTTYDREMGRLSATTVTTTRQGEALALIRESNYSYYLSGPLKGLLWTETIEPNQPLVTLTTTHSYDSFGNRVKSKQTGGAEIRCDVNTLTFDSSGRYVDSVFDCLGQKRLEVGARGKFGLAEQFKIYTDSTNFYTQSISYSAMGREYYRSNDSGVFSTSYRFSDLSACPVSSVFASQSLTGGRPLQQTCYDVVGRVIRSLVQGFDGQWDIRDIEYDILGQLAHQSEPGGIGSAQYWTSAQFDTIGRITGITLPDGSPYSISYEGLLTRRTNALGQEESDVKNILSEIVDTFDSLGGHTQYQYDHRGNLKKVIDNTQQNETVLTYDIRDHKKMMSDPDKGTWTYDYNNFGELISQTNGNLQTSSITYDGIGRIKTRLDKIDEQTVESDTLWTYDNALNGLGQLASIQDMQSGYIQAYDYDNVGRITDITTSFGADTYYQRFTYDSLGRRDQQYDARDDFQFDDYGIQRLYNDYGYPNSVVDVVQIGGVPREVYSTVTDINARGQIESRILGNGATNINTFEADRGLLINILTSVGASEIQDLRYDWDEVGNLNYRHDYTGSKSLEETFGYDALNRLTSQTVQGQTPVTVTYDAYHLGNIEGKSDVSGTYVYGENSAGPHAVTSIGSTTYDYDDNGNNIGSSDGRSVEYTTFDKPYEITTVDHKTEFQYGPNRRRYKRTDTVVATGAMTTTKYIGNTEFVTQPNGDQFMRRYIDGIAVESRESDGLGNWNLEETNYVFYDHLGSLDAITDDAGMNIIELSFDAWGQRREPSDWTAYTAPELINYDNGVTSRGFTTHEMLDSVAAIHMNGRSYDAKIARFMQADPTVQFPFNSQSLNRYSYTLGRPLSAVDPSGYGFWEFFDFVIDVFSGRDKNALPVPTPPTSANPGPNGVSPNALTAGAGPDGLQDVQVGDAQTSATQSTSELTVGATGDGSGKFENGGNSGTHSDTSADSQADQQEGAGQEEVEFGRRLAEISDIHFEVLLDIEFCILQECTLPAEQMRKKLKLAHRRLHDQCVGQFSPLGGDSPTAAAGHMAGCSLAVTGEISRRESNVNREEFACAGRCKLETTTIRREQLREKLIQNDRIHPVQPDALDVRQ